MILTRPLLTRLALVGASVLVVFGLGEVVARIVVPRSPPLRLQQLDDRLPSGPFAPFLRLVQGDADLFWRLAPNTTLPDGGVFRGVIANGQGLREERDIPQRAAPGERRILFVGDSRTFGVGVSAAETFVQGVEDRLRRRCPEVLVECINAGVPGYSLYQGWRFLQREGPRLQPDLVVLAFGSNGAQVWDGKSDAEHAAELSAARPPGWLRSSHLCRLLWGFCAAPRTAPGAPARERLSPGEFRRLLVASRDQAWQLKADLLILVLPCRENLLDPGSRTPLQDVQLGFARTLRFAADGPALVDGLAMIQELGQDHSPEQLFLDSCHPTAFLHERLADALAEQTGPWLEACGR